MDEQQPLRIYPDLGASADTVQGHGTESAPGGHPMEIWISHVLRAGVMIAGAIIAFGLLMLLIEGPGAGDPISLHDLQARGGQPLPVQPFTVFRGALHGQATAIIQTGVLALILTPIIRVAMTIALFILQQDRIFVAITSIVFLILIVGLVGIAS